MVDRHRERAISAFGGNTGPHLDGQPTPAADDVLLFLAVAVRRRGHAFLRIYEFFAILGFLRKVHQDEAELPPIAEPEIGDVPAGVRWEGPLAGCKTGSGRPEERVDITASHGEFLSRKFKSGFTGIFHRVAIKLRHGRTSEPPRKVPRKLGRGVVRSSQHSKAKERRSFSSPAT